MEESIRLLTLAARLMLEFNVRSSIMVDRLARLARHLGVDMQTSVTYRGLSIHLHDGRSIFVDVPEYRLNVAASSEVLGLVEAICSGAVSPAEAMVQMRAIASTPPQHNRWLLALIFGMAASALACILKGDMGSLVVVGFSSALGLLLRRELGRRHAPLLLLPFTAALLGGLIGGLAARFGFTQTPGLALMVPALMLVPGPHLINALFDIFENQIPTGVYRLTLATFILLAAALGMVLGSWMVIDLSTVTNATSDLVYLTLWLDMVLAGIAACGFGAFYNSPWRVLWISIVCGMVGHAIRFLCLTAHLGSGSSTLFACIAIGFVARIAATRRRLPFSSIAFAGAVPMMPGTLVYRGIASAFRQATAGPAADPAQLTAGAVHLLQALSVVGAMATGLLVGSAVASVGASAFSSIFPRQPDPPKNSTGSEFRL